MRGLYLPGMVSKDQAGIPDFQAPPPIPAFIATALAIDELPE